MAIDLMNLVQVALGGQGLKQISNMLGTDEGKTASAFGAGLPAILGGLMKQAATPVGAQQVVDTASKFDGDMLSKIAGSLGGGNHGSLIQTGLGVLGSIFGAQQSGLLASIARMTGLNQGAVGSLLGLIVPMVMSTISKAKSEQNLDTAGIASLLASQKDHVAKAMPAQLRDELGFGNLLGKASEKLRDVGQTATTQANDTIRSAGSNPAPAAKPQKSLLSRLIPIAAIAAIAVLGYQWLAKPQPAPIAARPTATAVASASSTSTPPVAPGIPDLDVLKGKLTERFGEATQAVGSITDTASAQAAADKLRGAASAIDGLKLDGLPGPAKTAIGTVIGPLSKTLQGALEKAYAIPGVEAVLKPVAGPMMEKMAALSA